VEAGLDARPSGHLMGPVAPTACAGIDAADGKTYDLKTSRSYPPRRRPQEAQLGVDWGELAEAH